MSVVVPQHTLLIHLFFFFPGPPNFGTSKQNLQDPQSFVRHPEHSQHCFFAFDLNGFILLFFILYTHVPARLSVGSFCDSVGIIL